MLWRRRRNVNTVAFRRKFCPEEFQKAGIDFTSTQINLSRNTAKHTLRGCMAGCAIRRGEVVRCVRGTIYDVVADIRPGSPTFRKWQAFELLRIEPMPFSSPRAARTASHMKGCDVLYQMAGCMNLDKRAAFDLMIPLSLSIGLIHLQTSVQTRAGIVPCLGLSAHK